MITFDIFAARDGDTYRGTVEADDEDDAKAKARPLIAAEFRIDLDPDDPDYFDGELDGFTVDERGVLLTDDATLALYRKLQDGLSDMVEGGRLTEADVPDDYQWLVAMLAAIAGADPTGQPPAELPKPLPIDLIVASRDVVAAFGCDVPDWIEHEIGMLELALKPFDNADIPMPKAEAAKPGDTMFLRQLEQRGRIVINNLIQAHHTVLQDVYGDEFDDETVALVWREHGADYDDIGCLAVAKDAQGISELWVSDSGGMNDGDEYTLVWVRTPAAD